MACELLIPVRGHCATCDAWFDDPGENEGRALYRARADALARAQVNTARRLKKLSTLGFGDAADFARKANEE